MQEGLLWFDDSPTRAVADKVGNAVARYKQKYGHSPDVCYAHPSLLVGEVEVDGLKVLPAKTVLPNHFWLGVQDAPQPKKKAQPQPSAGGAE